MLFDEQNMTDRINNIIGDINNLLDWYKIHKPEQYEQVFSNLAETRLQLREMADTIGELSAIAVYGECQTGKSHLIESLLRDQKRPFMVKGVDGETGKTRDYNFLFELNPIGRGMAATGVVTRFSSFILNSSRYSEQYPVLMKVLSAADLVCLLSDGMHNDVVGYDIPSDVEIEKRIKSLEKYKSKGKTQDVITVDDVMNIRRYLRRFVNKAQYLSRSGYLIKLAQIIENVPIDDFDEVFSILWYDCTEVSDLFRRLLKTLDQLRFSKYVYLPIDAICHNGNNENTILSVECLYWLYDDKPGPKTEVFFRKENGEFEELKGVGRSFLSALSAEIILKISEENLTNEIVIDTAGMSNESKEKLKKMPEVKSEPASGNFIMTKSFLNNADILDFPGDRDRRIFQGPNLAMVNINGYPPIIDIYLRSKTAYLFNTYSDAEKFDILMYCHGTHCPAVRYMYKTIQDWVYQHVGDTPEKRRMTMNHTGGIPPLFLIQTMFDLDMRYHYNSDSANSEEAMTHRWTDRFYVLYRYILQGSDVEWVNNWTDMDDTMQNTYIHRDFMYSGCRGYGSSHIFKGYNANDDYPKEETLELPEDYYHLLRHSFEENEGTKKLIADPQLTWDMSATLNNDGSGQIIAQLNAIAPKISEMRKHRFNGILDNAIAKVKSYADKEMLTKGF